MARRRMFSLDVIDTDKFIDMPQSIQMLYIWLSMNADDDGLVGSPKKIIRCADCNSSDLSTLIDNGFIISFESGVVAIIHWLENNDIRKDRYKKTMYTKEFEMLKIVDNIYVVKDCQPNVNQMDTKCKPNGNQMDTQVRLGKDRLGKDRLGKDNKENINTKEKSPQLDDSNDEKSQSTSSNDEKIKEKQIRYADYVSMTETEYNKLIDGHGKAFVDQCIYVLDNYKGANGKKYKSDYRAILTWVVDKVKKETPAEKKIIPDDNWIAKLEEKSDG